jgi:iron-sulfur cluster insertion protein
MTDSTYAEDISNEEIHITGVAVEQIAKLYSQVDDDEIAAIRIFVSGGGCAGMSYGMTFTDRRSDYDKVLKGDGFDIYVDAVAMQYLKGVEIDYVSRPTGASFVFNNVFATTGGSGTCGGCGGGGGF